MVVDCNGCKKPLELSKDNFHIDKRARTGFVSRCKTCIKAKRDVEEKGARSKRIKQTITEEQAEVEEVDRRHLEETRSIISDLNARDHRPIPMNRACTIKRLGVGKNAAVVSRELRGKFVEAYQSYLVFEFASGIRECFRKNDLGIEWTVEGR